MALNLHNIIANQRTDKSANRRAQKRPQPTEAAYYRELKMFLNIQNLHWVEVACQLFIIPGVCGHNHHNP